MPRIPEGTPFQQPPGNRRALVNSTYQAFPRGIEKFREVATRTPPKFQPKDPLQGFRAGAKKPTQRTALDLKARARRGK